MDEKSSQHDPITQLILDQIGFFGEESVKRRSAEPLREFQEVTDAFYETAQCLGTLKHEVALDHLKRGFTLLRGEAWRGIRDTWNDFWHTRRTARQVKRDEDASKLLLRTQIQGLTAAVAQAQSRESRIGESLERACEALRKLEHIDLTLAGAWYKTSWFTLLANGHLLLLYFRYLLHRIRVLLTIHSFVFLVPITIFGIGYSLASQFFIEYLVRFLSQAPWVVGALTIAMYAFKKYILDKNLKKLQVKLEASLFAKLNVSLLIAKTLVLRKKLARTPVGDA